MAGWCRTAEQPHKKHKNSRVAGISRGSGRSLIPYIDTNG